MVLFIKKRYGQTITRNSIFYAGDIQKQEVVYLMQ